MPPRQLPRIEPTDDWQQLELLVKAPAQRTYELIRPVVLFGRSPAEHARETGAAERAIYRQAAHFDAQGKAALLPPTVEEQRRRLPADIRRAIVDLKAAYPPFGLREIAGIIAVRFGHAVSHKTVKRILATEPVPTIVLRRYAPYHQIADPAERRLAIIRLHAEGWHVQSIAAYLETSRQTVYTTLRRWIDEGVAGLDDKSHAPKRHVRKVTLATMLSVRDLQENPELGEWRIHAELKQLGIEVSPRTCGRILARNRALYGLGKPSRSPREPQPMPFRAARRHQYWAVDLRYLDMHQLGGGDIYVISVLDNYSRAILASGVSRTQDVSAYLIVLYAALRQFGAPEAVVSDGGGIFRATQVLAIYEALGIRREQIERRQAWQSFIETQFNVMRRMADWHFAHATSWAELLAVHDQWVVDFNSHFTVTYQPDGKHLRIVEAPQLFETAYRSPQVALWALDDDQWRKAIEMPPARRTRRPRLEPAAQAVLFAWHADSAS